MQVEMSSVSTKGQVVIPKSIRQLLGISPESKLIVMTDGENILMKPVVPPRVEVFNELIDESRKVAEKAGLTPDDVDAFIKEARSEGRR